MKKVTFQGFELTPPSTSSIEDLLEYIGSHGTDASFQGYGRIFYLGESTTHHLGLVLTAKNQKRFLELTRGTGKKRSIKVRTVGAENDLVEFNYFILNKSTGKGLYQHYHQSMSMTSFLMLLKSKHEQHKDARIKAKLKGKKGLSEADEKRIKRKFAGRLKAEPIIRGDVLEELLGEMKELKAFTFDISVQYPQKPGYAPLRKVVEKETVRAKFRGGISEENKIAAIVKSWTEGDMDKARVEAVDENGVPRNIKIEYDNLDVFKILDFDEVATKMAPDPENLDPEDLAGNWTIKQLLDTEKANASIFRMTSVKKK